LSAGKPAKTRNSREKFFTEAIGSAGEVSPKGRPKKARKEATEQTKNSVCKSEGSCTVA
jgi:hypothetical protein